MKSHKLIDEKELLLKLRDGDRTAFAEIYERYKVKITIQLFSLLKIETLVEDTLQELFFRVWENRTHIDPEKSLGSYLYRIAANLSYDHFRRQAKQLKLESSKELFLSLTAPHTYKKELDEALYRLIEELPPQRKNVLLLCKFENKSYEETGNLLGISTNAVKDHIIKANKFLKKNSHKLADFAAYCIAIQLFEKYL
ncbi:RNA polymerase sigma factor [Chryseobacterium angstadtii]|uniref:RNA polymerase sigma factor n=1 Tax=Chryseobacterium angstadtii TaxID=558151 RepID=UPI00065AC951|nr:RNA polymerase sigma factor [Chryseobacterium angstadtii]